MNSVHISFLQVKQDKVCKVSGTQHSLTPWYWTSGFQGLWSWLGDLGQVGFPFWAQFPLL